MQLIPISTIVPQPPLIVTTAAGGPNGAGYYEFTGLAPGTYRFTLVVDGTRWLVPAGVVTVPDEMGGEQGLLVVP